MTTPSDCRAQEPRYCWKHGVEIKPSSYLPSFEVEQQASQQAAAIIMSSNSITERNAAEVQFAKQSRRIDASVAGYERLLEDLKAATRNGDQFAQAHTQQRIEQADGLRAELLANEAIATFNPENPNALDRLFDGTGFKASRNEHGNIVVQAPLSRNGRLFHDEDGKQTENVLAYRRQLADEQKYVEKYSVDNATQDLPRGFVARVESGVDYEKVYVRDAAGNALALITLNPDHTFESAKINSRHNDGSVSTLPSLMALRAHLFKLDQRNNGPLPTWVSGDPEPVATSKTPVAAAATGDQLF